MTPARFRFLLMLEIVLSLAIAAMAVFSFEGGLSLREPSANAARDSVLASLPAWVDACVTLLIAVTLVGGIVGMYRFKRWGRTLYLVGVVCGVLLPLMDGTTAFRSGVDESVNTMLLMGNGALLALAFYSPLSERFASSPN